MLHIPKSLLGRSLLAWIDAQWVKEKSENIVAGRFGRKGMLEKDKERNLVWSWSERTDLKAGDDMRSGVGGVKVLILVPLESL